MLSDLPERVRSRISGIQSDRSSGAVTLARSAAETLLLLCAEEAPADHFAVAGRALIGAQPSMAPLFNLVNQALWEADLASSEPEVRERVASAARNFLQRLEASSRSIYRAAAELIPEGAALLTHSYSDTVRGALLYAWGRGRRFRVICTESRPGREGAALALDLAAAGIPATLIVDAAVFLHASRAGLAMVGADAVTLRGLVNKTGTAATALAAHEARIPIYALCGLEKFLPRSYALGEESPKDPAEILPESSANLDASNLYFETTSLRRFTAIVTEVGVLKPAEAHRRLARARVHPALL